MREVDMNKTPIRPWWLALLHGLVNQATQAVEADRGGRRCSRPSAMTCARRSPRPRLR